MGERGREEAPQLDAIGKLLAKWKHSARRLIWDAPKDKSMVSATRAMENDAMIYINCILEVRAALGITTATVPPPTPAPSAKQEGTER